MNNFPFTPFLVSLESDGFCFTLHDYERISMVLRSGGDWSINRLRFVLVSLLVKDNDQKSLFLKRFDEFFDLSHEDEAGFAEIDLDKALDDLRKLAGGDFDESGTSRPAGFRKPRRSSVFDKKSGTGSWWRTGFLALLLVCSLSQFFFNFGLRVEPVIIQPDISIIYKPPVDKNNAKPSSKSDEKERYRLYKNLPYVKDIIPVSPGKIEDWKKIAGAAGVLLTVILAYAFFLWKSHKIPKDKPPKWDKHGPRHFRVGSIGGKMSRFLDPDTLDQLGDLLGYFQSEHPGKLLNMPASIKDTIDRGVSSLVFRKRRQIYNLLILEDAFSESLAWNTVAGELAEGLEQRAIPVTYGRFDGSPGQFKTLDGSVFRMEDLEDQHRGYLVLIFSDGRGLHRQQDAFVLESLARWPMIAWMELREPRFWDESTDWPASYGIPVYPATKDGLVLAMGRFLTEQGTLEDFNTGRVDCRGILGRGAGEVRAYTERLLGDALVWAQACAMIQPVTVGMADALRGEFHELLPCERVERLFALPGTLNTVSGLKFSVPVLSVLRSGFVIHRNEEQQEQVLRFLLEKIRGAEPAEKGSVAYLAWEWQYERVRLELEPEKALKRLAELAAPGSLLASYVTSDMGNVGVGSGEFGDDDLRVPLRVRPKGRYALQRLGRIAKNSGIDVRESFPVGRKHWIAFCLLVLSFFGMLGWTCITYINFLQSVIQIYHNTKGDYIPVILEFKDSDIWQISSPFVIRSVLDDKRVSISATHDIKKNKECRITLFNSGKHYIKKLGVINESLEILFDVKNELRLCKETFEKIGLTIVRCPEGYNEEITLPTWRESLGDAVSENRLMSIGVVIQASEDEEKMLKPVEKLFESYSIDVLYRISLGTDGQLHLPEAFQQIQEDLGAWTEQCQVIVWPNYINKQGLTLADTEHFGRILAFGDEGGSEWVETFVKILEPAKELLVSEDELSVLPSVQVEGKGSPPLALIHSTKLDLSGISDLDTIKDFKYLTWLTLNSTQVSDLSPLKNLKNLSHLSFSNTQVGDLSPLKDLKNLSRLFLNKTQVT
ncbi:MAG: leucine-rich repeat domain-containing protein, partial [Desulfobacteraceae bacterium]|nr:leucine-rich repeat domain-containing protein [Desulfobacteraceae bacterium]